MEDKGFTVLLTTSGVGSRLGNLTDYTNKSLIRVGDKPAISHIIENYPKNTRFVITLGHYGSYVKQFLELVYPKRLFSFIKVKNYDGVGSSLLHSMKLARHELQCPFVFHVCDAIVMDKVPSPDHNWIGGSLIEAGDPSQYRTLNMTHNRILSQINEKGELAYDFGCPGLVGVKDFSDFWEYLDQILETSDKTQLSDLHVIQKMVDQKQAQFKVHEFEDWYDIGEPASLLRTRKRFKSSIEVLDKLEEEIYILNNDVIKFFSDRYINNNRVQRAQHLEGLVPIMVGYGSNFYKYKKVEGDLFSKSVTPQKFKKFLEWSNKNLWIKKEHNNFHKMCYNFYVEKTFSRIDKFLENNVDSKEFINGEEIPTAKELFSQIDLNWLCSGISTQFHGDYILDNILETKNGFCLLDWRQDFAGNLEVGDIYYDLAKLNHNLIVNHEIVNNNLFNHTPDNCYILCNSKLLECKEVLRQFITENGYDFEKIELLTALIWINMAPLHEYPFNKFLFNFGKLNLNKVLNNGR